MSYLVKATGAAGIPLWLMAGRPEGQPEFTRSNLAVLFDSVQHAQDAIDEIERDCDTAGIVFAVEATTRES